MKNPLNAGNYIVVFDEFPALKLRQTFLNLRSEPRGVVVEFGGEMDFH